MILCIRKQSFTYRGQFEKRRFVSGQRLSALPFYIGLRATRPKGATAAGLTSRSWSKIREHGKDEVPFGFSRAGKTTDNSPIPPGF